jgi:hypothetical protein
MRAYGDVAGRAERKDHIVRAGLARADVGGRALYVPERLGDRKRDGARTRTAIFYWK